MTSRGVAALLLTALAASLLTGCGTQPPRPDEQADGPPPHLIDFDAIPEPVPRVEPLSRYGNPDFYDVWGQRYYTLKTASGYVERGQASWYGTKFHGKRTSSGEPFDLYGLSAAHRSLPLPTYVRVTNLQNGRSTIVRVNDRGPFHSERLLDLSWAAAGRLGILGQGTAFVEVRAIDPLGEPPRGPMQARTPVKTTRPAPVPVRVWVQIGAFSDPENAERLLARLRTEVDTPAHIDSVSSGNATLHRLRVGPLASVDEAEALREAVARVIPGEPRVVIEEAQAPDAPTLAPLPER